MCSGALDHLCVWGFPLSLKDGDEEDGEDGGVGDGGGLVKLDHGVDALSPPVCFSPSLFL